MINCAVVGATGYTGIELVKILLRHPRVRIVGLTTRQKKAIPLNHFIPGLSETHDLKIEPFSFTEIKKKADFIFLCLPHTEAMQTAARFQRAGKVVIDLSADFRLKDAKTYETWYGVKHREKALLKEAVYGLPELNREKIQTADLIANPGCYPTGALLGLLPLLRARLVDFHPVVIDSKSGVSGAGKKLKPATQFAEVDENFYAYKVNGHQHTPEIEQALSSGVGSKVQVTFVPHLLPVFRGILTTLYLKKRKGVKAQKIIEAFKHFAVEEPFVKFLGEGVFPSLKEVQHTNDCRIGCAVDNRSDRVIVITAIDNLLKGASGQAVQNMNLRCGFEETEGIELW